MGGLRACLRQTGLPPDNYRGHHLGFYFMGGLRACLRQTGLPPDNYRGHHLG